MKNFFNPIGCFLSVGFLAMVMIQNPLLAQKKSPGKPNDYRKTKPVPPPPPPPIAVENDNFKKTAEAEGITEYVLPNGLKVLLFPDQSKQTNTVNITYLVGSRNENYGETGMAHLLEHLVFKGTPKHPNIPAELTSHGARPNGTTWLDRTNYFETFAATDENLKWALDLEADRMINSYIAKKDLDSEMTVVRNEFESGENNPSRILNQRIVSTAYLWHNYGKSTIGARSDIENVPIDKLQAFYRKYYQPDNAILLVGGKIDPAKTLALITEYFGKIPRPTRVLDKTYTSEPTQDGERNVILKRSGDIQVVACAYHIPPGSHPDYAAIEVLIEMLTAEPSGALYKALIETKKASQQYGYSYALKEPGIAYFNADVPKEKSLEDAKKTMLDLFDNLKNVTPTKEEVERAKNKLLKDFDLTYRNTERVGVGISEYIATGDWRLAYIFRDWLRKVSVDDIVRVQKAYFKPSNRTVGIFIPEQNPDRAEIPQAPDVESLVKDYKGDPLVAEGEAFDPSPTNIESRTTRNQAANGMKYAFLTKKTKGNVVSASITLRFGDENSLQNRGATPDFVGGLLERGTTKMSRQQIKDEFDRLKARVSIYGGASSANANIETTRENLPAVIKLVAEVFKNPIFPEKDFEELKAEYIANSEQQKSDPQALASMNFSKSMNQWPKSDPRYVPDLDEEIANYKAVKIEDVRAFYRDFYGANNATASVVGDFDEKELRAILDQEFGNWRSNKPFSRLTNPYKPNKVVNENIKTPDKANAMFLAGMTMPLKDTDPDYPSLVMGNYMLGGGFLNSRLAVRIRQKEGLSYGVGSMLNANALDQNGSFSGYAIYAPENVGKLEQAFKEEINRVLKDGFTKDELEAARNGYLQSRQVGRAQDRSLAGTLNNYLFFQRDMKWDEAFENQLKAVTPESIKAAFNKYIDLSKMTIIKAGDFDKIKKP